MMISQYTRYLDLYGGNAIIERNLIAACLEAERRGLSPTPPPTKQNRRSG